MKLNTIPPAIAALVMFAKSCLAGDIMVMNATIAMPLVPTAKAAAASFVIMNHSALEDSLENISTPVANHAELHQSVDEGGVMHMVPVPVLNIPANADTDLSVQHMHVMLSGLHQPLHTGDKVQLILHFEKAGTLTVDAIVGEANEIMLHHVTP
jgi:periplasmic copper chaperone A